MTGGAMTGGAMTGGGMGMEMADPAVTLGGIGPYAGAGSLFNITATVTDDLALATVTASLTDIGGTELVNDMVTDLSASPTMFDYSTALTIPATAPLGMYTLTVTATDMANKMTSATAMVEILPAFQTGNVTIIVEGIPAFTPMTD